MQYHSYLFFNSLPTLHTLSPDERLAQLQEWESILNTYTNDPQKTHIEAYGTLGFKTDTRFMLHVQADLPQTMQQLANELLHTPLGQHVHLSYTLFGMTRTSPYKPVKEGAPATKPNPAPAVATQRHTYLIVYPFTKTIAWHLLPMEERRDVMKSHVEVGRKWSGTVGQLLLYAYGIDDHEFIVSYYTDTLEDFQSLVMDMRATESRRHTKNDLPIFLCIHKTLHDALEML